MSTERQITNWKTSIIGVPMLLFGFFMIVDKILVRLDVWQSDGFSVYEIITTLTIGWAFFNARDTLLSGMFGLIIKLFTKK